MATISILQREVSFNRIRTIKNTRPNLVTNLIIRMGLGLFMAILPLLFFRFIVNFSAVAQAGTLSADWQMLWAGHISWAFVTTMFTGVRIALIIRTVSMNPRWLKKYGRLVGRICTIGASGFSVIVPYMTLMLAKDSFLVPTFLLACIIPVVTFIVVRSATKDYLLRVRIWFDSNK